ncbi:MAG: hypothetical protein EA350_03280 [Gemmatimonadales bacterium]|nr:MAG: hypothetical protein EA350_03280 [Gemmatimonadales bacterium]
MDGGGPGGERVPPGPGPVGEEEVQVLVRDGRFRVERIVSRGHASPPGFWYDQPEHEWVMVLAGRARLDVVEGDAAGAGEGETIRRVEMAAGAHLVLPARRRHRVAWTDPDQETIWLAVFWP